MFVIVEYLVGAVVLGLSITWLFFEVSGGCCCSGQINYIFVIVKYLAGAVVLALIITWLLLLSIWRVQLVVMLFGRKAGSS